MKKPKTNKKRKSYVYKITINKETVYIGLTADIHKRQLQHNSAYKRGDKKQLYDYLRSINFEDDIVLEVIYETEKRIDAKRYECLLILQNYFTYPDRLKQKCPSISDR